VEAICRRDLSPFSCSKARQVHASLISLLDDFDAGEATLHDALAVAVEQWARDGVLANPRAWLV
jgi:RNA polymerase sigma-70 factor, ECF subfamily